MIKKKFSQMQLSNIPYKSNKNFFKKDSLISILKNDKKTPSISIDSKNSALFNLNQNDKIDKNDTNKSIPSNLIQKQKSLTLSKINNNYFPNKTSNSSIFLKKLSHNIIPKILSSKKIPLSIPLKKYYNTFKSGEIFTDISNNNDMNNETEFYISPSLMKYKRKNDFEISEEDKMFDEYLKLKKKSKNFKEPKKVKIKIKTKKKLNPKINKNYYTSNKAPLNKVYKKMLKILDKIESTKKLKNYFSLIKYQNLLLNVGSKSLDLNSKVRLDREFTNLRNSTNKQYELLRHSVRDIEKAEKAIIDNVNKQQDNYKKNMKKNNYHCMTIGMNFHGISNLKFHKTITKLKYKNKGIK